MIPFFITFSFQRKRAILGCVAGIATILNGALLAQDAPLVPTPTPDPLKITQQEIIRRQEKVFVAVQSISQGKAAEDAQDYPLAQSKYSSAIDGLGTSTQTAPAVQQAVQGLVRVDTQLYQQAIAKGDVNEGRKLLLQIQQYDPKNTFADQELKRIAKSQADPTDTTFLPNPAMNPQFQKDVAAVQGLFLEEQQFERTGQYDEAAQRYQKILGIDPYNEAARTGLQKLAKIKSDYYNHAGDQTRYARLSDIENAWSQKYRRDRFDDTTTATTQVAITRNIKFQITEKLRKIIIPSLDFSDSSIDDAVNFFISRSKELDPEKQGINIILKPEATAAAKKFTLSLRNVPLGEALRYVTQLSGVKSKVDDFAVTIYPLTANTDNLLRREFLVPPSFFTNTTAPSGDGATADNARRPGLAIRAVNDPSGQGNDDIKQQLTDQGVEFPPGAGAVYTPDGRLQVVDTQEQLDLIEELVGASTGQTIIVEIESKLVEINQSDMNDATFNYLFNPLSVAGVVTTPSVATALRGSQGFTPNGLDQVLGSSFLPTPTTVKFQGLLNSKQYRAVLTALASKSSTDLLSAPSVRVRSGDEAKVDISRTFFFPKEFDAPETATENANANNNNNGNTVVVTALPIVIPSYPSSFDSREIGVTLTVRPQVGADRRTISLVLVPQVTDFEGFINYGDPIFVTGVNDSTKRKLSDNFINQPVFNTRKITSSVNIRDGYTVALGGLLSENIQEINDKVPVLGDLPFVGRFFQSKATQSIKKNLIVFVTARLFTPEGELLNRADNDAVVVPVASQ